MQTIIVELWMDAPIERCFDAARDLDLHLYSMRHTAERAVAGRTTGLIGLDEEVTWEARRLGVRQRFTSRITQFDPPHHFRDAMQRGAFKSFVHDHDFVPEDSGTRMIDKLVFAAPLGILGLIAEKLFLTRYLDRLLRDKALGIKEAVERGA